MGSLMGYLAVNSDSIAAVLFMLFFVFRYLRLLVGIFANLTYQSKEVPRQLRFGPEKATVIIPTTLKEPGELTEGIRRVLDCLPAAVIVVTSAANVEVVTVLGVDKLNKRVQMLKALEEVVDTDITGFADNEVFWPTSDYLHYLLVIFKNPKFGAGSTRQRVRRKPSPSVWNFLGISYLEHRVFNNITTNAIDGFISTLSCRTATYRTKILQDPEFIYYFQNDQWRGKLLNSDDDKCLTRYVYSHGRDIAIQAHPEAVLETTVEDNPKYLDQCLRWARAHWHGNFTVMENELYWCSSRYWFGLYVICVNQFFQFALVFDSMLFFLLSEATHQTKYRKTTLLTLTVWIFFTKLMKLIPHFVRHLSDLKFVPVSIAFSYYHGFLNLWAFCTLTRTHWGGQSLESLVHARAENEAVIPLLRKVMMEAEPYREPTSGRLMEGDDYFSVEIC